MAIIKPNNNTISAITALPAAIPTGKVLQVVQGSTTTSVTHSTTYADTNLSATITPSSTSNKILILINQHCYLQGVGGGATRILRDSTTIQTFSQNYAHYIDVTNANTRQYFSYSYLDTPSSTSALTYKTQAREYSGGHNDFQTQNDNLTSFITLMEVAG